MTTQEIAKWILEETGSSFASVFEAMAGSRPEVSVELLGIPPVFSGATFGWSQPLSSLAGEAFLAASEEDVIASGQQAMIAAGVEDASEDEKKSTFLECIKQVFSALAQAMTNRREHEVTPAAGRQSASLPDDACWGAIRLTLASQPVTYFLALPAKMLDSFAFETTADAAGTSDPAPAPISTPASGALALSSAPQNFDLLLDVELPVNVSFGHAHVPLKDVLKLTTGSIVELSRAVVEPVDIVVNNCVIAKGEVVVVEGNFGVRIQHVVSRNERLRTLQ
jgi:flagellar motor switch protein FliN/FliY